MFFTYQIEYVFCNACLLYRNVVSTWSSGTGGSGLFGALSFAALTTAGLSARKTVLLMLVIPGLMAITFFFILDHEKQRVNTNDRFLFHKLCVKKIKRFNFVFNLVIPNP